MRSQHSELGGDASRAVGNYIDGAFGHRIMSAEFGGKRELDRSDPRTTQALCWMFAPGAQVFANAEMGQ